jgi:hypothetical protein
MRSASERYTIVLWIVVAERQCAFSLDGVASVETCRCATLRCVFDRWLFARLCIVLLRQQTY